MNFLHHAQTVFLVIVCLMALVSLYGKVRTEMDRLAQPACEQRAR